VILSLILLTNAAFLAALVLTGWLRRYALRAELIDLAGDRSSHQLPTPRGGGAAIVLVTTFGLAALPFLFGLSWQVALGLSGGGAIVALVGWLDDHGHVRPAIRLAHHFAGAIWLTYWVGPFPLEGLPFWSPEWGIVARILSVFFIVWMINLYNFMDGIDGVAGGEAVAVTLAGAILLLGSTGHAGAAIVVLPLLLAAAVLGFLPWNWPPARIFMGDVSSGYLGFMLAAMAVVMGQVSAPLAFAWAILPGVFIADTTVTLARRLLRREKVYEAHRSHAYQRWTRRIGEHLPVTMAVLVTTWLWLFPMAYLIATGALGVLAGVGTAMLPLFFAAFALGAGRGNE
jgi:Fuc2NAc and GlcNAc transferase